MDPIQPITPLTPRVGSVPPLPSTRRVDPDPRRDRGRDPRREPAKDRRESDDDTPDTRPHIDITA